MANRQNIDFVLRTVEERNIRFVRLWFTDVLGNLKSFACSPEDLDEAFEEGIGFDGSSVEGFAPLDQSDMLAFPDPETFQILPGQDPNCRAARMICDIKTPSGASFPGDPRACLERAFRKAERMGYLFMVGPEIQWFYFSSSKEPIPIDEASYFDLSVQDSARTLRRITSQTLEMMSVPVTYSYHAAAPSQNGIQLRFAEGRTCADNIVTARHIIKKEAFLENLFASFMPKPFADEPGSALFLHQSLFNHEGQNLFWGGEDDEGVHLSDIAKSYIAGILKYADEMALIVNPTVNSYKRMVPTGQVPTYASWGKRNRGAYVRIPAYKPGKPSSARIELRSPDPTCNPYLVLAVTLAAGLKGIEDHLELPEMPKRGADGRFLPGIEPPRPLPYNMGVAIKAFERSELMCETLGNHIYDFILKTKRKEWQEYSLTVTQWERDHYYVGF